MLMDWIKCADREVLSKVKENRIICNRILERKEN